MEIITGTQSLRDTVAVMKGSKIFPKKKKKLAVKFFEMLCFINHLEKTELVIKITNL